MKTIEIKTPTCDKKDSELLTKIFPSRSNLNKLSVDDGHKRAVFIHSESDEDAKRAITYCLKAAGSNLDQNAHFILDMSDSNENWLSLATAMNRNHHINRELLVFNHRSSDPNHLGHKNDIMRGMPFPKLIPKRHLSVEAREWLAKSISSYPDFIHDMLTYSKLSSGDRLAIMATVNEMVEEGIIAQHFNFMPGSWGSIIKDEVTMNYALLPGLLSNKDSLAFMAEFYINLIEVLVEQHKLDVGLSIIGYTSLPKDLYERVVSNSKLSSITLVEGQERAALEEFKGINGWATYFSHVSRFDFLHKDYEPDYKTKVELSKGIYYRNPCSTEAGFFLVNMNAVKPNSLPIYDDPKCSLRLVHSNDESLT